MSTKNKTTIGQYLLDALYKRGVRHIFGLPGDYVLRFDKLIEQHKIHFVNTTRENTAGYMADAYGRFRGMGVACITYGVGINITNALSQAFVESSPLVVISGAAGTDEGLKDVKLHHLINKSPNTHPDTTQLEIFKQVTIDQAVLNNPSQAQEMVDRVLDNCIKKSKPVYIEIPRDMVEAVIEKHTPQPNLPPPTDPQALKEAIAEVEHILRTCRRPVIWVGHEIQRFGLADVVLKFAEKYRIPIISSLLGKTTIDEHHPLFVGVYMGQLSNPQVIEFVDQCDCAFVFGVMLTDIDTGIFTAKLNHEQRVVACTDGITIGHHSYNDIALSQFLHKTADLHLDVRFRMEYPSLADRKIPVFKAKPKTKITAKRIFECVQHHLTSKSIIATDIGDCLFGSADLVLDQNSFLACAYFASLGFGTPGAIGAQIAEPQKRVIGIVGDGAFQMTSMELSTAVRYGLDPIIIVLNNHGFGTERPLLEGAYNDIQDWNYSEIPRVLGGGIGLLASTEEEFDQALTQAMSERGTFYLIEVPLEKTDFTPTLQCFFELISKHTKKS